MRIENGESVIMPVLGESIYRYIANENALFAIRDTVYKVFKEGIVYTHNKNMGDLLELTSYNEYRLGENLFFSPFSSTVQTRVQYVDGPGIVARDEKVSGKNRIVVKLGSNAVSFNGVTTYEMYVHAAGQKKFLGMWHAASRNITYDFAVYAQSTNPNKELIFKEKGSKKSRDVTFVLYGGVHVPLIKLGKYKCTASIPEVSSAAVIRYAM